MEDEVPFEVGEKRSFQLSLQCIALHQLRAGVASRLLLAPLAFKDKLNLWILVNSPVRSNQAELTCSNLVSQFFVVPTFSRFICCCWWRAVPFLSSRFLDSFETLYKFNVFQIYIHN